MIEGHDKYNETTKEQSKYAGINWDRLMGDAEGAGGKIDREAQFRGLRGCRWAWQDL